MYQDGRHPAIPTGTKLHFLKTGDFDEITNTNGNLILWYVPDQYLTQYLGDVQRSKEDKRKTRQQSNIDIQDDQELNSSTQNERNSEEIRGLTNEDVEREIDENYEDSIPNNYLEAYLSDRISQVYSDRLKEIGVFETKGEKGFDLSPFLNDKLYYFNELSPSQAYRKITEELESYLEFIDKYKNIGGEVVSMDDKKIINQTQRKIESEEISSTRQESTLRQINGNSGDSKKSVPKEDKIKATRPQKSTTDDKKTLFDRFGDGLDNWLTRMEKFEKKMNYVTDKIAENGDRIIKNSFEILLRSYRINPIFIKNRELAIKSVNPNKLLKMDAILGKTKEKTKGEKKNDEFEQGR